MTAMTLGDMARRYAMSHNINRLKTDTSRLTQDLSTGLVQDPVRKVHGDIMRLATLDQVIAQSDARMGVVSIISARLEAQQTAINAVHNQVQHVADMLLRPDLFATDGRLMPVAIQVRQQFEDVVSLLNAQSGGRSLFSGQAVDRPALADAQTILLALSSQIPAGAGQSQISQFVDAWFAPGGGFDTSSYLGGDADTTAIDLGDGVAVRLTVTAADPAVRKTLATLAKGAIMDPSLTDVSAQTRRQVLTTTGLDARANAQDLREVIEGIGVTQSRTDLAATRQQSAHVVATMARTALIGADPYDTATALQDTINRVDQMFALTARLSRLSLSAYL